MPLGGGPAPPSPAPAPVGRLPGGTETVLVVDDEETVRQTMAGLFRKLGYRVLQAADGEEGLEMWRGHPEVELVLLDISMPRLSGTQVLQAMRAQGSGAKVLCITGHAGRDCPEGADGVVTKPFSLDQIARQARQVLDA